MYFNILNHLKVLKNTFFVFVSCLFISLNALTQNSNAWINYDQQYLKFNINKAGLYRIYGVEIKKALGLISNPKNIQIFFHGKEVAKRFIGLEDSQFDELDYLEFYGQINDGQQDSLVYRPHNARPNVNHNLYTDDAAYFITIGKNVGLEIETIKYTEKKLKPETYHNEIETINYSDEWSFNNSIGLVPYLQQSYYERGESWTGRYILKDSLAIKYFSLKRYIPNTTIPIGFKVLINGRNYVYHSINTYIGNRSFSTTNFFGFDHFTAQTIVNPSELDSKSSFTFSTKSSINDALELYSWSKIEISYPQSLDMAGLRTKLFYPIPTSAPQYYFEIQNAPEKSLVYDISNTFQPRFIENHTNLSTIGFYAPNPTKKLLITSELNTISNLQKITFDNYSAKANYIIVTHSTLKEAAKEYADYRTSTTGGSYKVIIADIEQLYNQFNYGERSPIGIKNFLVSQLQNNNFKSQYLFLIGRAVSFPDVLKSWADRDLVPTFGYPGSDNLLSAGLGALSQDIPAFLTGRLNVTTNQEIRNYLDKVKEFEQQSPQLWNKKVLHLNGGKTKDELAYFKSTLESLTPIVQNSIANGEVEAISKQTDEAIEQVDISQKLNAGVGMISFVGHASPTAPDFNIGLASSSNYDFKNKGKYPLMYFNGCGVGNIFYRYETLSTDWILTPNKGAIAILANSFWSYANSSTSYLKTLYQNIYNNPKLAGESIGFIQQATLSDIISNKHDDYDIANAHQVVLQGDPAIKIFDFLKPDYAVDKSSIIISADSPTNSLANSEKAKLTFAINNLGQIDASKLIDISIMLKNSNNQTREQVIQAIIGKSKNNNIEVSIDLLTNLESVNIIIDKAGKIDELNEQNNSETLLIDWKSVQYYNSFPLAKSPDIVNPILQVLLNDEIALEKSTYSNSPILSFVMHDENPLKADPSLIDISMQLPNTTTFSKVNSNLLNLRLTDGNTLVGSMETPKQEGIYNVLLNGQDLQGNKTGQNIRLSWEIVKQLPNLKVIVSPNPAKKFVRFQITSNNPQKIDAELYIFDTAGKNITAQKIMLKNGVNEVYIEKELSANNYIYKCQTGQEIASGKLIVN